MCLRKKELRQLHCRDEHSSYLRPDATPTQPRSIDAPGKSLQQQDFHHIKAADPLSQTKA